MKLNLGCGNNKLAGFCNIDKAAACSPDLLFDLEEDWPLASSSIDEIAAHHIFEHIADFVHVAKETYRVLKLGGQVRVRVPHPRHDAFLADPTHCRPILPTTLEMFSKRFCAKCRENGMSSTPLADYHGVDMELKSVSYALSEEWRQAAVSKEIGQHEVEQAIAQLNNVCVEIDMVWEKAS